jgi:hypothetical protein
MNSLALALKNLNILLRYPIYPIYVRCAMAKLQVAIIIIIIFLIQFISCVSTEPEVEELLFVPYGADLTKELLESSTFRSYVVDFYIQEVGDETLARMILDRAQSSTLDVHLIFALSFAESSYNPKAINYNRGSIDRGLFQLNNRSFPHVQVKDFFDPELNISLGVSYLEDCFELGRDAVVALAMYNAGRNRVRAGNTPQSTLEYIGKILSHKESLDHRLIAYLEDQQAPISFLAKAE